MLHFKKTMRISKTRKINRQMVITSFLRLMNKLQRKWTQLSISGNSDGVKCEALMVQSLVLNDFSKSGPKFFKLCITEREVVS